MEYTRYDETFPRRTIPEVNAFAQAAFVFGLISIFTCMMFFISIPCGALAIIFALLSRKDQLALRGKAKKGLCLGVIGAVGSTAITVIMVAAAIKSMGGWESFLNEYINYYEQMTGMSVDDLSQTITIYAHSLFR